MERNFSVDDIVGTLWKLDTNSSNTTTISSNHASGDPTHSSNFSLEIASAQDVGGPADEVYKRITRVDSYWGFQDYFKLHDITKAEGSDTPERAMRRNESMWAFQEFLKNYVLNEASKAEGKIHESCKKEDLADGEHSLDLNMSPSNAPPHKVDCSGNSSQGADEGVAHDVKQGCILGADRIVRCNTKNSHSPRNVEGCNPNLSNSTHIDVSVGHQQDLSHTSGAHSRPLDTVFDSRLTEAPYMKDDSTSMEPFGNQHHTLESLGDDAHNVEGFREQQVSGALNPLFTGLQNVMPNVGHGNPQEYEMMLKRQLDLACAAVASKRACYRLNKGVPQAGIMGMPRLSRKFNLSVVRPLSMAIDWCRGH
ncbi:hypothetical protein GOP47_0011852 [Adiantum capillus-veneris]|uniref:Uncharacterized protein n=1 Tax=Adiantum capillus-veneris TaxID=13818 RepID=A0A9D4ZFS3_ADICA|nr:hypothetical protein GOP47_0011852 [Adiantum capillus-veneris]